MSRGHAACKFMNTILEFYGNKPTAAYVLTDNQAAEHIATRPTINEHSRSIDTRHHAVRQDAMAGTIIVCGVNTTANTSDILTKYLPAPTHSHSTRTTFEYQTHHLPNQPTSHVY
jgi:hypothetical protein